MDKIKKFFSSLNTSQEKIVFSKSKNPMLVLAGPGSGKTRVIIAKIVYLIKYMNIDPNEILALTFTNKAANEMNDRINDLLKFDKKLHIQTFHSFGSWLLRVYYKDFNENYDSNFTIWDTNDVVKFVKQIDLAPNLEMAKHIAALILKDKENFFLEKFIEFTEKEYEYIKIYEEEKAKNNAFDFSDLIIKPILMLRQSKSLKESIQSRFKVIFVDEYQDTNYSQFLFLKELYLDGMYFMVVGDEDQSIYSFRGARIENILEFEKTFDNVIKFYLVQNYRSNSNIVGIANEVISKNKNRYEKQITTQNSSNKRMKFLVFQSTSDEAEYFSNLLISNDIKTAILYRFNSQSFHFETSFLKKNIPYKVLGSIKFYDREEIKDIICLLRLFINKKDKISFLRMINKPSRGIGKTTLDKIISSLNDEDVNFNLFCASKKALGLLKNRAKESLLLFLNVYDELGKKLFEDNYINLSTFIEDVVIRFGLLDYYKKFDKDEKLRNIDELINSGIEYSGTFEGLAIFLENSSLSPLISGNFKSNILLSSIHGVKGLEFDRVVISGLEKGLLPAEIEELTEDRLEEERRLFYVAITRAKSELIVTLNLRRAFRGSYKGTLPSVFFQDIDKNSYDIVFIPEYLKENFNNFFINDKRNIEFNIGDYIIYNGEKGIVVDSWYQSNLQFVKISLRNGKKAILSPEYIKKIVKV
ncbi:ATP-dependent helicase [Borreliella burgdorferi]|uniref:ATP-dependent helicase n=3 Tax=Borreliella burgdorferi TaxID=139 RepID=UPI0001F23980|nr:ATP-dependent helicase [Borreliella burgdorferi]ADQ29833.1 DNA helicase [Borreliella burgdorferi N40]MCD2376358.1 ATP-dependent helicase [Borreliella burgdorferi]MCD2391478.1 ATP-dependent helicase [Borreliella burgdorferi]MCD2412781.1 ATP-dependent helicase [Borreliella burgdorferi]MDO7272451.1 ATP-dependent helicase [Borreliella burgdorferi]